MMSSALPISTASAASYSFCFIYLLLVYAPKGASYRSCCTRPRHFFGDHSRISGQRGAVFNPSQPKLERYRLHQKRAILFIAVCGSVYGSQQRLFVYITASTESRVLKHGTESLRLAPHCAKDRLTRIPLCAACSDLSGKNACHHPSHEHPVFTRPQ